MGKRMSWAVVPVLVASLWMGRAAAQAPPDALASAVGAAQWIASHTVQTAHGATWASDPEDTGGVNDGLYSGASGVVLFLTELWRATGDDQWLALAADGANNLLANLPDELGEGGAGLYSGVAGIGFVLERVHAATGDAAYLEGAQRCVALIKAGALTDDAGVHWGPVTDIISGSAGTGLFLLWAHETLGDEDSLALAAASGRSLLARGIETDGGMTWRMAPDFERLMPNFSHGTAGIAFFFARLYEATGDNTFLAGALEGAGELQAIADTGGDGFRVHHHTPGGEDLYYVGWCHGPVGTSRLFTQLGRVGANGDWAQLEAACAQALVASGAPETRSPGHWENVSRCCGSAGMGDFFASRYELTAMNSDLALIARSVQDVLARATTTERGLKWIQAEHRTRPDLLVAQTGLAQGASGVGLMLLRYDAAISGRDWPLRLPDEVR